MNAVDQPCDRDHVPSITILSKLLHEVQLTLGRARDEVCSEHGYPDEIMDQALDEIETAFAGAISEVSCGGASKVWGPSGRDRPLNVSQVGAEIENFFPEI